jgi:hypothetical protein
MEIIVVDSCSTDGTVVLIRKRFPQIKLIELKENKGFGFANNIGVEASRGEWVLLLNPDTELLDVSMVKLTSILKQEGANALKIIGCQLVNKDRTIQPSVGYFPNILNLTAMWLFLDDLPILRNIIKSYQKREISFYRRRQEVDWVTGAMVLMPRLLYIKVGGFDENIFLYGEEVEMMYRLKKAGASVVYNPEAQIVHLQQAASETGFEKATIGEVKALFYFFKKYRQPWQLPIIRFVIGVGALLRQVVFGMINGNKGKTYGQIRKLCFGF